MSVPGSAINVYPDAHSAASEKRIRALTRVSWLIVAA